MKRYENANALVLNIIDLFLCRVVHAPTQVDKIDHEISLTAIHKQKLMTLQKHLGLVGKDVAIRLLLDVIPALGHNSMVDLTSWSSLVKSVSEGIHFEFLNTGILLMLLQWGYYPSRHGPDYPPVVVIVRDRAVRTVLLL